MRVTEHWHRMPREIMGHMWLQCWQSRKKKWIIPDQSIELREIDHKKKLIRGALLISLVSVIEHLLLLKTGNHSHWPLKSVHTAHSCMLTHSFPQCTTGRPTPAVCTEAQDHNSTQGLPGGYPRSPSKGPSLHHMYPGAWPHVAAAPTLANWTGSLFASLLPKNIFLTSLPCLTLRNWRTTIINKKLKLQKQFSYILKAIINPFSSAADLKQSSCFMLPSIIMASGLVYPNSMQGF